MICLSNGSVKANQDYKDVIKRKMKIYWALMVFGVLTAIVAIGNALLNIVPAVERVTNLYSGIGFGLIAVSVVFIVKYNKLLKNEIAMKEERLKNLDERNILISRMAAKSAAMVLVFCSYIAMLIGGLFSKVIFYCFWWVVMVFLIAYVFFSFYYRNKKL